MHLLQIAIEDTITKNNLLEKTDTNSSNIWLYIAFFEFIIIVISIIYITHLKRKKTVTKFEIEMTNAKAGDIDMVDLMLNINKSKELYKELSRKCHPDKHINSVFQKEIEELFQEITNNKRNFQELVKLKEIAINKFNIKID